MDTRLASMRDAFAGLTDEQRDYAMHWMIGALSFHVTAEKWNELVIDAVRMSGHRPEKAPKAERSGKDASTGPE